MFQRKSVWANGGDFDDPILLWYAKGVGVMKSRSLEDKTSWRFIAAIHGIDENLWHQYGYYTPGEPLPSRADQELYWNQCQHQSWYFLPWHRGYVLSLESNVRKAIIDEGGPDDWALPYWDYSSATDPNSRALPPAFSATTLPDGSENPLYVAQRYDAQAGTLPLPPDDVSLMNLNMTQFIGTAVGGNPGFGGPQTIFWHGGGRSGGLESLPHNIVHVDVGQGNNAGPGLMSDPDTAGLDPIFFLHHCNIDRLWSFWLTLGDGRANPTTANWLNGPVARPFIVPDVEGEGRRYAPKDVLSTEALGYQYDPLDNGDEVPPPRARTRNSRLGIAQPRMPMMGAELAREPSAELLGANQDQLQINEATRSKLMLDRRMMTRSANSFSSSAVAASAALEPDRYYLHLENIRANREGLTIDVLLHVGDEEIRLASLGLFGVKNASRTDLAHGGAGMTVTLDVTDKIDDLHLAQGVDNVSDLDITVRPSRPLSQNDTLTIERISLYRES